MSKLREAFEAVRGMALAAQSAYTKIDVGSMPAGNSLCMAISAGGDRETALNSGGTHGLDIVVNARHAQQATTMDALADIHHVLTRATELPCGTGWQVTGIKTSGTPCYLDYDGKQWLYGSALEVTVYFD